MYFRIGCYVLWVVCLLPSWIFSSVVYGTLGKEGLQKAFQQHLNIQAGKAHKIGYLEFKDSCPISESTYLYVKHALQYFQEEQVAFVIAHFNSFGGELIPTIKIVDLFQKLDVNKGIPLIAYIDRHALASSSMLVYACRFIAVSKEAVMGGALDEGTHQHHTWHVPQNFLPYLLSEYASLATLYGRDPTIAEAMVDPKIITAKADSAELVSTDQELLMLTADQMISYGVADFEVTSEESFSKKESWPFHETPLAKEAYLASIGEATVIAYSHWMISLLVFLTYPPIGAICVVGIIVAFYLQIKSRQFNRYGAIGCVFLALLILSSFALQAISWVDMIFLGLGVTLIILDSARKVSGGGVVGFLGIGFTVVSLMMLMLPGFEKFTLLDFETSAFVARSLIARILWLSSALVVSWIFILLLKKHFVREHHPLPKESVMITEAPKGMDFLEKFEESSLPKEGSEGMAHCSLRPTGKVLIQDKIYDAISHDGKTIFKRSHIIVVKHLHGKLVVKVSSD